MSLYSTESSARRYPTASNQIEGYLARTRRTGLSDGRNRSQTSDQNFDGDDGPDDSENRAIYRYLPEKILTPDMVAANKLAYSNPQAVAKYAAGEWAPKTIKSVEKSIILPLREQISLLPAKSRVLVAGCGTLRDLALLALLRNDVEVVGFDLSEQMLLEGHRMVGFNVERLDSSTMPNGHHLLRAEGVNTQDMVKWVNVLMLAQVLSDSGIAGAWIVDFLNGVLDFAHKGSQRGVTATEVHDTLMNSSVFQQMLLRGIQERIAVTTANVEDRGELYQKLIKSGAESSKFNLILAVAMLPHVPKNNLLFAIDNLIELLKLGGTLYFDARVDQSAPEAYASRGKGRVFMDTVIGLPRYFDTNRQRGDIFPLMAHLQSRGDVSITMGPISPHPDPKKPGFLPFFVQKKY